MVNELYISCPFEEEKGRPRASKYCKADFKGCLSIQIKIYKHSESNGILLLTRVAAV